MSDIKKTLKHGRIHWLKCSNPNNKDGDTHQNNSDRNKKADDWL